MAKVVLVLALLIFPANAAVNAQTPFTTDDAEVADKGKVHMEFLNEYDLLQKSLDPSLRQDSAIVRFSVGVAKNIELGLDVPIITIFNSAGTIPRRPFGFGDVGAHIKIRLNEEKEDSRLPSFAFALSTRFPTGNAVNSLGSGVTNYQLYGVVQKSVSKKTKARINAGVLFAGNTVIGALGVRTTTGRLFSGGASLVKEYTEKLKLGVELTGVASSSFQLSKGQLQTTLGGNYDLKKNFALDFGVIVGRFPASPRAGALVGFSYDF